MGCNPRVDGSFCAYPHPIKVERGTLGAKRPRIVTEWSAVGTLLEAQLVLLAKIPERLRVFRRSWNRFLVIAGWDRHQFPLRMARAPSPKSP